jgi:hypothetical protein
VAVHKIIKFLPADLIRININNVSSYPEGLYLMIGKEEIIDEVVRVARARGYKIESNTLTGETQINFGNKKLHVGHLGALYPSILSPSASISSLIEQVAPGRPCANKPMREIIEQLIEEKNGEDSQVK